MEPQMCWVAPESLNQFREERFSHFPMKAVGCWWEAWAFSSRSPTPLLEGLRSANSQGWFEIFSLSWLCPFGSGWAGVFPIWSFGGAISFPVTFLAAAMTFPLLMISSWILRFPTKSTLLLYSLKSPALDPDLDLFWSPSSFLSRDRRTTIVWEPSATLSQALLNAKYLESGSADTILVTTAYSSIGTPISLRLRQRRSISVYVSTRFWSTPTLYS